MIEEHSVDDLLRWAQEDIDKIKKDLDTLIDNLDIVKQENINLSYRIKELEKNDSKNRK